jgi:hypothetical protein
MFILENNRFNYNNLNAKLTKNLNRVRKQEQFSSISKITRNS